MDDEVLSSSSELSEEEQQQKQKVTVDKKKKKFVGAASEPLTKKQELNNHIVLMRKVVRRARVHLINKLTKEVKKLKEYKGEDVKAKERASRKAARLLGEIKVIKHLKEDKVSIFALQNSKSLEEILQNLKSTEEERALGRVGCHLFVQEEVTKYREKNPHWKLQIPVLLEKSKEKRRQIDKKLREREAAKLSGSNATPVAPNKSLSSDPTKKDSSGESENDSDSGVDDDTKGDQSEESSEEELRIDEEVEDKIEIPVTNKPLPQPKVQPVTTNKPPVKTPAQNKNTKPVNAKKNKAPTAVGPTGPKVINKKQGTVRIKVLNSLEDLEEDEEELKPETKKEEEAPLLVQVINSNSTSDPPAKKRPKSSFFVGGEDEEDSEEERKRKERQTIPRKPKLDSAPGEFKPIFRKGKLVNKPPPRNFQKSDRNRNNNNKSGGGGSGRYFDPNLVPLGENKKFDKGPPNKKSSLLNPQQVSSASADEKLHPSWEAKKRQQISLSNFKGKKITFGDDE